MRPFYRWGFTVVAVVITVTGFAYLYMNEAMTTDDPFALVNHPWQIPTLVAHIVAAPILIAFFGMLLSIHTLPRLRSPLDVNQRSGQISLWTFVAMALSAYLHQISTAPLWIDIWWWVHIVSACAFVAGYAFHFVIGYRLGRFRRFLRRKSIGDG